jgi:NitT/TauT family transport system ATP-binding protein
VTINRPRPHRDNALDLPRPRDVSSPEFNGIRRVLGAKLHSPM